jgi:hypothetical protein
MRDPLLVQLLLHGKEQLVEFFRLDDWPVRGVSDSWIPYIT